MFNLFKRYATGAFLLCTICKLVIVPAVAQERYDTVIRNGRVFDGSGNPWFYSDIAIREDRIVAVGQLEGARGDREIDATGFYVSPGFIDAHSHAAGGLVSSDRSHAHPLLAEGVTTVVINPDGGGPVDLAGQRAELMKDGLGIHVIQMAAHGAMRNEVMGMVDRLATKDELTRMKVLMRQAMENGAFGLSSGPFYPPGSYADTRELVELAQVASEYGGIYTSHIRDESDYTIGLVSAVEEVIEISRSADIPSVVTHIKALGPNVWGYSQAVVERIKRAREEGVEIYTDQYPYLASSTGLAPALLPRWAQASGRDSLLARFNDPQTMQRIVNAMAENLARRGGAERIRIRSSAFDSTIDGRWLSDIATEWNMTPVDASIKILKQTSPGIISYNMHEKDLQTFMMQHWNMTASDGGYPEWGRGTPHPRAFGTFPRKIRTYVLEKSILDLATAIRSMTGLPAQVLNLRDRGTIREGAFADLLVFDLDRLRDRATFEAPFQLSQGMVHVIVNGHAAIAYGAFTGAMAGQVLRRQSTFE